MCFKIIQEKTIDASRLLQLIRVVLPVVYELSLLQVLYTPHLPILHNVNSSTLGIVVRWMMNCHLEFSHLSTLSAIREKNENQALMVQHIMVLLLLQQTLLNHTNTNHQPHQTKVIAKHIVDLNPPAGFTQRGNQGSRMSCQRLASISWELTIYWRH